MTRGRWILVAFGVAAILLIASPAIVFFVVQPTLCPTQIVREGRVEGGIAWEITRSDCSAERVVWQVRVAPLQGAMRLAYDAENGPEPAGIDQRGRTVTVQLKTPLRDGSTRVEVELDHRARPREPARIRAGARVSAVAPAFDRRDMAALLPL